MIKLSVTAAIALLLGAVVANLFFTPETSQLLVSDNTGFEKRLNELETRLEEEISQREQLQKQLDREREQRIALANNISELSGLEDALSNTINNQQIELPTGFSNSDEEIELLVSSGFDEYEAERILELENNARQALFNARFGNQRANAREVLLEAQNAIRNELGDDQFENYLEARGRPTTVQVARIQEGSAGEIAGMQLGDEILSYDGERVFSILDLQQITQTGTQGQTVIIEVLRDSNPVSLAIPRGQIGISTAGFGQGRGFPVN